MKVYVNRKPINGPWGGGAHFVNAFYKFAPDLNVEVERSTTIAKPEVILLAGLDNDGTGISVDQAIMYQMYSGSNCKIILRVNENDARKGTQYMDDMLIKVSKHINGTVFVSEWLHDYFMKKGWACQNNTVIYNGVDQDVFKPQPKLGNGKLNIVAHHWSDNRMKGADVYEELDRFVGERSDQFAFTYIGRHKCDFKHTKVIKPLSGKALGQELGKHDVYISASRWDPGPNHIVEGIACDLPTYVHVDGGGCVEFAGADHTYRDWEELKSILLGGQFKTNTTTFGTWKECIERYVEFFCHMLT